MGSKVRIPPEERMSRSASYSRQSSVIKPTLYVQVGEERELREALKARHGRPRQEFSFHVSVIAGARYESAHYGSRMRTTIVVVMTSS